MMRSEEGRGIFREFLRSEYSEENLLFWIACEELKKETNPTTIEEKARIIYEDYVSILSPKEVRSGTRVMLVCLHGSNCFCLEGCAFLLCFLHMQFLVSSHCYYVIHFLG